MSGKATKKPVPESSNPDRRLREIFGESTADLKTVIRAPQTRSIWLSRIIAFLLLAVFSLGAFLWFRMNGQIGSSFAVDDSLVLNITAPPDIKSGDTTQIIVDYQNPTNRPLANLIIRLQLPPAFHVLETSPTLATQESDLSWTIGSLGQQSDGRIVINGQWLATVGSSQKVQAVATFKPVQFNSEFTKIAAKDILSSASVLSVSAPDSSDVPIGFPVDCQFSLINSGSTPSPEANFSVTTPPGFAVKKLDPSLPEGSALNWLVPSLAPGQTYRVSVQNILSASAQSGDCLGELSFSGAGDQSLLQSTTAQHFNVLGSDLITELIVNGSATDAIIEPGKPIVVTARIKNLSADPKTNLKLVLDFQPESGLPIAWSKADLGGGKLAADGVTFSGGSLGSLSGGGEVTFRSSYPLKDTLSASDLNSFSVVARLVSADLTIQSLPVKISLGGGVKLTSSASYGSLTDNDPDFGPLPPKVGVPTSFVINWSATKEAASPLDNIVIRATLPNNVIFESPGLSSVGEISYDLNTKTVSWQVPKLSDSSTITASFVVSLIPTATDVGKIVDLLSSLTLSAHDSNLNRVITASADKITTAFPNDSPEAGKGLVTP